MFIGHFATALVAKKIRPEVSLGTLFFASQFIDLIWPFFVLLGLEKVSVDLEATKFTPLNFEYYPFSHSLLMTCVWGIVVGGIFWLYKKNKAGALTIAILVVGHWILDYFSHRADMPLAFNNEYRFGLGLWNSVALTIIIELSFFIFGIYFYLKANPKFVAKRFWSLMGFLIFVYFANAFGPKPPLEAPAATIAGPALAIWILVFWAYWVEKPKKL